MRARCNTTRTCCRCCCTPPKLHQGGPPPSPQIPPRQLNGGSTEGLARLCWQWFTYFFSHSTEMRNWENEYEEHQMRMASPWPRAIPPTQNGQLNTGPCYRAAVVLQVMLSAAQPRREFGLERVYVNITSHEMSFRQEFLSWRERQDGR